MTNEQAALRHGVIAGKGTDTADGIKIAKSQPQNTIVKDQFR
jgi:hypothetical protein